MAVPAPIEKRSLDRQAAEWIREAIASGNLAPGARVTEIDMAAQIGLSRSTVRAAMQRLASEGLLVQQPYAGWEVPSLSVEDAWELYTLRASLEGLAARLAAQRIDAQAKATLQSAVRQLRAAVASGHHRSVARADMHIHKAIVLASGHKRLMVQYHQVVDLALLYVASTNTMVETPRELIPTHEALVELILAGKASAAEKAAIHHVSDSGEKMIASLEAGSMPSPVKRLQAADR